MALNPDDYYNIPAAGNNNSTIKEKEQMIKRKPKKPANEKKKKRKPMKREKMEEGENLKSEAFSWKVMKLLGSGGFGDVYKVQKTKNQDKNEYAMKTEMVEGDKRMLRLKIEVTVLKLCHEVEDEKKKKHFVEFVDRGITDKFKFLVMGLVGPSLEDIRKSYLLKNFSKATSMNAAIQTLKALADLHDLGWLHRDIKPQNYAVGLGEKENVIYMLDFGIAKKIFKEGSREVKPARSKVKFLGTLRFASRACHKCKEQGRKDDVETWIYMVFDLIDYEEGLPWKRAGDKEEVVELKEKFFKHGYPKAYGIVFKEFKKLVDYINGLEYADEPDYKYMDDALKAMCKDHKVNPTRKLDWIGRLKKKREQSESDETSTDNKQSGSASSESEPKKPKKKPASSKPTSKAVSKKTNSNKPVSKKATSKRK